ncbi:MAG: glutamate-1-semialdehyde 2,1-aminomutase [Pirellulales bacterium]|nr:glutamate-1-semialdehyde 2,1-aminomutase [Pirellulales bacterium]
MSREKSQVAFARARQLIPGGVNSPARAFGGVGGEPIFFDRGQGAYLIDIDGNRYIDYVGSWGPMILGHCHPKVVEALETALRRGTSFGAPTEAESDLAELIIEAVPSIEKVRLVNSGTEATMSALRLARGFTGRPIIVKFAGGYHGHVDSLLVAAGSSAATLAVPNSPGVTEGTTRDTLVLRYNDVEALEAAFAEHGRQIAAVIVEPVAGNMGCVKASLDFREALRDVTRAHGALLIFDEVMSGFRVAYGGAQALFGVTPDLTTLGKIIGGGLPVGAYGGRADVMEHVLPAGKVFQAGTLSGNPLATAAGIATLKELRDSNPYEDLQQLSTRLAVGLEEAAKAADIPCSIGWMGAMMTLFFDNRPVTDWDVAARCDTGRYARYFWGMIQRGVYLPCSQYEALFLSTAHTEADVETTVAAAREVFQQVAVGGPSPKSG